MSNCTSCIEVKGCAKKIPAECVFYSGANISGPNIFNGDNVNIVINKLTDYINSIDGGGGTTYAFENGITESGGIVKLGGTLTQFTTINATSAYRLSITGAHNLYTMIVSNTSTSTGGYVTTFQASGNSHGIQVIGSAAANAKGVRVSVAGTNSVAVEAIGNPLAGWFQNVNSTANNTELSIVKIVRTHFGATASSEASLRAGNSSGSINSFRIVSRPE